MLKNLVIDLFYVYGYFASCVSVPHTFLVPMKPEEDVRPLSAGITDGCEPLCTCWELSMGPLEEQTVLLTVEPSSIPFNIFLIKINYLTFLPPFLQRYPLSNSSQPPTLKLIAFIIVVTYMHIYIHLIIVPYIHTCIHIIQNIKWSALKPITQNVIVGTGSYW